MCVVSMVTDHYGNNWMKPILPSQPSLSVYGYVNQYQHDMLKHELEKVKVDYDALKKEVENMRDLLVKAKLYDEQNNEPDCAKDEKIEVVKAVAKALGVDLPEDLF